MTDQPKGLAQGSREWRCFHCDEVFTDPKAAANHFGVDHVGNETLCQMAQVDGGIARVIADLAEELQRYRSEDNASYREFYALGADHSQALIREEQKGYDRGLADGRTASGTPAASTGPNALVQELRDYPAIDPRTCVVAVDPLPDGYNVIPRASVLAAADEIELANQQREFAEFEWNRATDGMKERDATIAQLRGQVESLRGTMESLLVDSDGEEHDDGCELCDGCGEVAAVTTRSDRDQIGCPGCIERAHSRTVRSAISSTVQTGDK